MSGSKHDWDEASREKKRSMLVDALVKTGGSITAAAAELQLSRQQVTVIVRDFELREFAGKLRLLQGGVMVRGGERKGTVLGRVRQVSKNTRIK